MSRSLLFALALGLLSVSATSVVHAQRAVPVEALAFDGLTVQSIRAPDSDELPVRVVLARAQEAQFRVDVWVAASSDAARAMLAARLDTLSTLGLSPRAGFGRAQAFATTTTGSAPLVALTIENVVLVVRAIGERDASPLAAHLVAAVLASAPAALATPPAPAQLDEELTIAEPSGAVDWLVTCDGACRARRLDHAFCVTRSGPGAVTVAVHVVDAFLRASHVAVTH